MSYGMVGYSGSLPACCELCARAVSEGPKLPVIAGSELREYDACRACYIQHVTDAALFWQSNGRPMNTAEAEQAVSHE